METEVDRVFGDRLISEEDLDLMKENVESLVRGHIRNITDFVSQQPCIFGDFEMQSPGYRRCRRPSSIL